MSKGPIAELIRTRRIRNDGSFEELDILVCPMDREADLLEFRPEVATWKRDATRSLDSNVVLFLSSNLTAPLPASGVVRDGSDGHV